jgi:hypothetical protein
MVSQCTPSSSKRTVSNLMGMGNNPMGNTVSSNNTDSSNTVSSNTDNRNTGDIDVLFGLRILKK